MDERVIYNMVASVLRKIVDDGVSMKKVSTDTGLSSSTLYKFMRQDTIYPRFHTLMCVLEYLGFKLTLTKKGKNSGRVPRLQNKRKSTQSKLLQ